MPDVVVCGWCKENPASATRVDPIGEPWCDRCADAEEAVQAAGRERLARAAMRDAHAERDGARS